MDSLASPQLARKRFAMGNRLRETLTNDWSDRRRVCEVKAFSQSGDLSNKAHNEHEKPLKYGQFDTRTSTDSYLAALRNIPAPWRVGTAGQRSSSSTQ
jgi:hypothetical protein